MAAQPGTHRRILHIIDSQCSTPDPMERILQNAGAELERCANLYSGLARLSRSGARYYMTVVRIDYLPNSLLEFCRLVRELNNRPVLIYGEATAGMDIQRAISAGDARRLDLAGKALLEQFAEGYSGDATRDGFDEDSLVRVPWARGDGLPKRRRLRRQSAGGAPMGSPSSAAQGRAMIESGTFGASSSCVEIRGFTSGLRETAGTVA